MKKRIKLTYNQIIALGFLAIILTGALLLCLPVSTREHIYTPFVDCLFTATSSTCVTGLIVFDTYTYWSVFGQIVIIIMIQLGGIGLMSVISMLGIAMKRKISLGERLLLKQAAGSLHISGIAKLIINIARGTFIFEGAGTVLLAIRFCPKMGFWEGLYNAVFHSVSAFCNAGFDLMGKYGQFVSLSPFADDAVVSLTVSFLIITGGLGFIVWSNILSAKLNYKKYTLHTKLVLVMTVCLLAVGTIAFFVFENNNTLNGLSTGNKLLHSFFHSATTRTAGFSGYDLAKSSPATVLLTIILMFIGGSPGSTAGGIKTTTLAVLLLSIPAAAQRNPQLNVFKRRIELNTVFNAAAIATIYILATLTGGLIISYCGGFDIASSMFEAVSAAGTVGLTLGITTSLNTLCKFVVMLLMFGGRIGGLSLALMFTFKRNASAADRPAENILIG